MSFDSICAATPVDYLSVFWLTVLSDILSKHCGSVQHTLSDRLDNVACGEGLCKFVRHNQHKTRSNIYQRRLIMFLTWVMLENHLKKRETETRHEYFIEVQILGYLWNETCENTANKIMACSSFHGSYEISRKIWTHGILNTKLTASFLLPWTKWYV